MSKRSGSRFVLLFTLLWTAVVLTFDIIIAFNTVRQMRAATYPVTQGTITYSEVASHTDSDGTTYGAEIAFRYQLNGRRYSGDTWRYGAGQRYWLKSEDCAN